MSNPRFVLLFVCSASAVFVDTLSNVCICMNRGMLGTLMGLDTIKVMSSIPLVYLAIKMRNINPIEDKFNG